MKYYVTTGASLSQASRCWLSEQEANTAGVSCRAKMYVRPAEGVDYDTKPDGQLVAEGFSSIVEEYRKRRAHVANIFSSQYGERETTEERLAHAREVAGEYFSRDCWSVDKRRILSAEMATIVTMSQLKLLKPNDSFTFLVGDTNLPDGYLAAATTRLMLKTKNVTVKEIGNVDPKDASFTGTIDSLWESIEPTATAADAAFLLTAGYKAVILDLAVRVSRSASVGRFYYLYERAPGLQAESRSDRDRI